MQVEITCQAFDGSECNAYQLPGGTEPGDADCIVDVTYTYTATNVGEAPITITSMIRLREGDEPLDLTDQVDPKDLDVGDSTAVQEADQVDYCVPSAITTIVQIFDEGEECVVNFRRGLLRKKGGSIESDSISIGKYDLSISI